VIALGLTSCGPLSAGDAPVRAEPARADVSADRPLAGFQQDLLELAFDTATAIPLKPHIKDRARAQAAVVEACLRLDQPLRASRWIEQIPNWRQGTCYADLALYWAERGLVNEAERCLHLASQIRDRTEDWRRDRIQVGMAKTHAWLGRDRLAEQLEEGVVPSETGKVLGIRARLCAPDRFDQQLAALDALIATGDFDVTRNALEAGALLFDTVCTDAGRRSQVEQKVKEASCSMPLFIRIDLLLRLAGACLEHTDQHKALELVNEAQVLKDGSRWPHHSYVPLTARLAGFRYRAGDRARARTDLDAARALFDAEVDKIVNIERAAALRPIAEAYGLMGDTAAALAVCKRAVEEGVANPNSRPRAEDLSATCCSMAVHGVEPDRELWRRIRGVREGLGPPW
jgi:hypothetical protein